MLRSFRAEWWVEFSPFYQEENPNLEHEFTWVCISSFHQSLSKWQVTGTLERVRNKIFGSEFQEFWQKGSVRLNYRMLWSASQPLELQFPPACQKSSLYSIFSLPRKLPRGLYHHPSLPAPDLLTMVCPSRLPSWSFLSLRPLLHDEGPWWGEKCEKFLHSKGPMPALC